MKINLNKNKGITLIALVITIILLLILSSVAIRLSFGNNGIVVKSSEAVNQTKIAQLKERIKIALNDISIDYIEQNKPLTLSILYGTDGTDGKLAEKLTDITFDNFTDDEIKGTFENYSITIHKDLTVTINEKTSESEPHKIEIPVVDFYISPTGDDSTGDGSLEKPYGSINKAISMATSGSKIFLMPGEYTLTNNNYTEGAIYDRNKEIEIIGANENTVLILDNRNVPGGGFGLFGLKNINSIARNLTCIYYPNSGNNYCNCILDYESAGKLYNVFIRICGQTPATYIHSEGANNAQMINCTVFHDLNSVSNNYRNCHFNATNFATNAQQSTENGTKTNIVYKSFGDSTNTLAELIYNSKQLSDFKNAQVGVFYGTYAWY